MNKDENTKMSWWRGLSEALPMRISLVAVAGVWMLGCAWSFQEQSAFAASRRFAFPHLLPLVIDGFAVASAGVSWAASLDARAAVPARLATVVAVGGSAASNGTWAWLRTAAHLAGGAVTHDVVTVVLGVAVPVAANLAFEVLLSELRRQVQRRRGLPAPVLVPYPRLIRLALAPVSTFRVWRALVLQLTALDRRTENPVTEDKVTEDKVTEDKVTEDKVTEDKVTEDKVTEDKVSVAADELAGGEELTPLTAEVVNSAEPTDVAELIEWDDSGELALQERARAVIAGSLKPLGRRQLARELDVTEHTARRLLATVAPPRPDAGATPELYTFCGSEGPR